VVNKPRSLDWYCVGVHKGAIRASVRRGVATARWYAIAQSLELILDMDEPAWLPEFRRYVAPSKWKLEITIPIWLLMVPFAAWLAAAFVRRQRRIRVAGLCPCGYDARGLDVCPECGRDAEA